MSLACPGFVSALDPGLCRAVDHYCERTTSSLDAEPLNAISNAAFLLAAWFAWRLSVAVGLPRSSKLEQSLPVLIAIVGLGSFLFHTVATRWAEWADVLPILVFMGVAFWGLLGSFFGWPAAAKAFALILLLAATVSMEAGVPGDVLWGGALYVPMLAVLLASAVSLAARTERAAARSLLAATAVFLVSITARMADAPLCPAIPIGTHFLWHILNAVVLYLLARMLIVRRAKTLPI
jgi:hypothetical protein